jgi:hypothetical protein
MPSGPQSKEATLDRPQDGVEVDLLYLLERREEAGWADRPAVVDELRLTIRRFSDGT